ncbi:MAG: hypothetical protein Kow0063_21220 [Anaerolineae bacterium]
MKPDGRDHTYRHHLYALLGYLALTLLMTYPLVREFGRAIPGDGFDGWQNVWNLWWVKRALLVDGTSPYFTRFVDYPVGVHLYFHTLNIFNGLTFLPFTLHAGPLLAYNVAVVFSFVAGGYGTYLLASYVLGRAAPQEDGHGWWGAQAVAFLGGVVFAFSPFHMAHLLGHMQLISLEWLPFYALFVIKVINLQLTNRKSQVSGLKARIPKALMAALFLVLVAACDWYYAFYMVLFSALYLLWTIWRRRVWLAPTLALAVVGLVFLLLTAPLLAPMVGETLRADYMVPPPGSTEQLSADLTAFLTPSELHPLWGTLAARWAGRFTASTSERTVFAGYSVLALSVLALATRWRAARFWGMSALVFGVLALGPVLHIGGSTRLAGVGPIPLPYALLHRAIPLLRISRSVSRFDVVVMLSLSVLAAIGLNWLLSRIRQRGYNETVQWLVAVAGLLVVGLEYWVAPYPMSPPETQPFHYRLGQEPGTFAIMDVPLDWDRPANLLYQTVHQKPTVSGYTSRTNPMSPAWRTPVLQIFRYLGPDINTHDPRALAATVLNDLDVRYVVVHKTDLPPGEYREKTLSLAGQVFGDWPVVVDDDWLRVYRVPQPADPKPYLVLGEGWAPREWRAGGPARAMALPTATLLVRLPRPAMVHLELEAYSLEDVARLEVEVGGEIAGDYAITRQATAISTPAFELPAGESVIRLKTDSTPTSVVIQRIDLVIAK